MAGEADGAGEAGAWRGSRIEGDETRRLALDLGRAPVTPLTSSLIHPRPRRLVFCEESNETERLFPPVKGDRRIFSRFEKLDAVVLGLLRFLGILEALRSCAHAELRFGTVKTLYSATP